MGVIRFDLFFLSNTNPLPYPCPLGRLIYNDTVFPPAEQAVHELLAQLGIPFTRRAHPPVFTVVEARRYDSDLGGMHCKNLFLRNKKGDRHYLVLLEQSTPLDLHALGEQLGAGKLSLASPQRLERLLGVISGAVGPFGLLNDQEHQVDVLIDRRLEGADAIGFHPNVNTATLQISFDGLMLFLAHCGNRVTWIE